MTRAMAFGLSAILWAGLALRMSASQVTFQVNMEIQTALNRFNSATDIVEVRGSFNGWGGGFSLANSPENKNMFLGTFDDTIDSPGTALEYKFVIGNPAGDLTWESINNRTFALETTDQKLPIVFFNNLAVNPGTGIPVTYQVNMAIQIATGAFNPGTDVVEARGPFNNWGGGFTLKSSPGNTNIYSGTVNEKTSTPGSLVPHKFVIVTSAGTVVWENGNNRTFTLAAAAQALPAVYFNNQTPSDPGSIKIGRLPGGKVSVSWDGRPGVYLQRTTVLNGPAWQDVLGTDGQSTAEFAVGAAALFFRLASLSL